MKELWNRTTDLFWQHPILWLPVLSADLLGFCLTQLQRLLTHEIVLSLVERHSVLSNTPDLATNQSAALLKAALLTAPFLWGTYFLNVGLYTAAFLITAKLVSNLLQHTPPDLRSAVTFEVSHPHRIFGFALKVLALFALAAIALTGVSYLVGRAHQAKILATPLFAFGSVLVVSACIAYYIVPSAIALMRGLPSRLVTAEAVWPWRMIAIRAVSSSTVSAFCAQIAEQSLVGTLSFTHGLTRQAIEAIASIIAAFPYVPLFIALSLAATRDAELGTGESEYLIQNGPTGDKME
jgi:hypothetical protein